MAYNATPFKDLTKAADADLTGSAMLLVKDGGTGAPLSMDIIRLVAYLSPLIKTSAIDNDKEFQTLTQLAAAVAAHNTGTSAHADIRALIATLEARVSGMVFATVFDTKAALDAFVAVPANTDDLALGHIFLLKELGVPDYWWDGTGISELETAKVDLTNIYTKTEAAAVFTHKPVSKSATLAVADFVADGTLFKATISDTDVSAFSFIMVVPVVASEEAAAEAGIYSEVKGIAAGSFYLTSKAAPAVAIDIVYTIFG